MLEYGETFLEQNRESLKRLEKIMTKSGYEVALEMAPQLDESEPEVGDEQPVAA